MAKGDSTSGASLLAAFIPAATTAVVYLLVFLFIRNSNRTFYAPRTFLGTVPEKDRTPSSGLSSTSWLHEFRTLPDTFILKHNSLDAFLFLRFLKFIVWTLFLGGCLTFPILLTANWRGGGSATQLDRLSFGNVAFGNKDVLWAHFGVAVVFFLGLMALIARERLQLVGIRQAYLLDEARAARLSSRTVLFLNVPAAACQPEVLKEHFGPDAERSWPVVDTGDLDELIGRRNGTAFALEKAEMDLIVEAVKRNKGKSRALNGRSTSGAEEGQPLVPSYRRPTQRKPPLVGSKFDLIERAREKISQIVERIDKVRAAPSRNVPEHAAIFVTFSDRPAAHRAFQKVQFEGHLPVQNRFLSVQPKEVLWNNLTMPMPIRMSKASTALVFVIAFTIFFSIPIGLIGTLSNVNKLADRFDWLDWIHRLPSWLLGLLEGFVPPYLISSFTSYVPKLFRHIAKMSGEPTTPQAELKTQAWYFVFLVVQVFLVTTISSDVAAVTSDIARHPEDTPQILAQRLPSSSNFYLTYFVLQGLGSAAATIVNYSDLFEYYFYEYYWDKTPREKFSTYSSMKGTPWASWFPKFTNFFVIAIAYACIAPLVLGFATVGIGLYYLSYRHQLLYVVQTKVDTQGEAYTRALKNMPVGIYIAELCLIGLFGARQAAAQTSLMVVLLVVTAILNLSLDRILRPLELYLGVDILENLHSTLAQEDNISTNDSAAIHAAAHGRRLGLNKLSHPAPRILSDLFDSIITTARQKAESWLHDPDRSFSEDATPTLQDNDLKNIYLAPALTSKLPKLWLPRDALGVSKDEIAANEARGVASTDEGAEIDEEGNLRWDHRFENVPIWSRPKVV